MACETCDGSGKVWTSRWGGNDPDTYQIPCPHCADDEADYRRDQREDERMRERWDHA